MRHTRRLALLACLFAGACGRGSGDGSLAPAEDSTVVVLATVQAESFPFEIEALGTAYANEAVTITAKRANIVTAIHFEEGEQVERGELLVELDAVETRAELAAARAARAESLSQYRRAQELRATQALSQSELERLEATVEAHQARLTTAQAQVRDTEVRAPFAGRVGLRRVSVGSYIGAGAPITTLDDTRIIKLDFTVPETFISALRVGQSVEARSSAWPGRAFAGTVVSLDSRVDPTTRSIVARAALPNPAGLLKPGMFLSVRLQQPHEAAVMVPEQALLPEEDRQFVFVVRAGRAYKQEVGIGRRRPGQVEILSGVAAGDQIVVEGAQRLREGSTVHAAQAAPG